jgi:hypothetical protein
MEYERPQAILTEGGKTTRSRFLAGVLGPLWWRSLSNWLCFSLRH